MIKKSLMFLFIGLLFSSFLISAEAIYDDEGNRLPDIEEGLAAANSGTFVGIIKGVFSSAYYKVVKPLVVDTIIYPILGVEEGEGALKSFFFFGFIGFVSGLVSLFLLRISIRFFNGSFVETFLNQIGIRGIFGASGAFGFLYGVFMLIPVVNRVLEIVTLQIFTHLLPDAWTEFATRTVLLSLTIIILLLLPSIIEKLWISKIRLENIEALHKEVAMKEAQRAGFHP